MIFELPKECWGFAITMDEFKEMVGQQIFSQLQPLMGKYGNDAITVDEAKEVLTELMGEVELRASNV